MDEQTKTKLLQILKESDDFFKAYWIAQWYNADGSGKWDDSSQKKISDDIALNFREVIEAVKKI